MGKSRVLLELSERLEATGVTVHRIASSTALSTVPFGVFAAAPSGLNDRGADELTALQRAVGRAAGDRDASQTVVVVDDGHLLDRGSAALVELAARTGVPILATLRRAEWCPDGVTALWRDEWPRVDLQPLGIEGVGEGARGRAGVPVDAHTRSARWN